MLASEHQGLPAFSCVSNSTPAEDAGLQPPELSDTWGGRWACCAPAGRAPCGGTASPEISTAKILTQLQLQIRTGCSCWNPGALQQQITAGNEKKPQRGRRRREEFPPLLEVSQKSAAMDLAHYFHSAKPASQYADPAPNDLHPELHLACWIPKICSVCVLAGQGPSMLGKHLIQFFKKALFCWAVT